MKIVFLDADTVGQDIGFASIEKEGEFIKYGLTKINEAAERVSDAEVIITNKVVIDEKLMKSTGKLKLICAAATGYNHIDIKAAQNRGIAVENVKGYSTESVVQTTILLLLALAGNLGKYDGMVRDGAWERSPMFTILDHKISEVSGKTLGIIGYGAIGKRVADVAAALGMNVIALGREGVEYSDVFRCGKEKLLSEADFISIHTPLNEATKGMIGEKELKMMKRGAFIINTARGGIIDEEALYRALTTGDIAGAGLDVLGIEPPANGNKLIGLSNCIVLPHIAWGSVESRQRLIEGIANNIKKYKIGDTSGFVVGK